MSIITDHSLTVFNQNLIDISSFIEGLIFINGKVLRWSSKIGRLLKEWKPKKDIKDDCLTLIWGDIKFFKSVLEASSVFYPEETLVKDRLLKEFF